MRTILAEGVNRPLERHKKRGIYPDYFVDSCWNISAAFLKEHGISALAMDIDNTMARVDAPDILPKAKEWLDRMRESGFKVGVVSNNDPERVEPFAQKFGLAYVSHACKPSAQGFKSMAAMLDAPVTACAAVGDQLLTDIKGGNSAGMLTIAVRPISEEDEPRQFRKRRVLEKVLLYFYGKTGLRRELPV